MNRRRTHHTLAVLTVSLVISLGMAIPVSTTAAYATATAPSASGASGTARPVDVVILADESGSMREFPNEMTGMRAAAALIGQEEWSPQSQVSIYGFGSAPPGDQPQAAIDQYCAPTELSSETARGTLEQCGAAIRPRTEAQGWNTDFAEALTQAKNTLSQAQAAGRLPLVFIMTDGQLDVGPDSPYAGPNSSDAAGNAAAQQLIANPATGILHQLRSIGAEIWPVGFGQANTTELSLFARGGAQNGCPAGSGATPSATIVAPAVTGEAETQAIQSGLVSAFAEARCAVLGQSAWFPVPQGGSVTKNVTISPLATLGALIIDKGDSRVTVSFADPDGHEVSDSGPAAGSVDGATYTLTKGGPQSPLETLRLDDPLPGPWTVTFTVPQGVPAQTVGLSLVWQGEVQLGFLNHQDGDPGHQYQLAVQPSARSAPVPATALAGFTSGFTVSWPNGQTTRVPGRLDASGDFAASVAVPPGLNGLAHVTATVAGPGVQGEVSQGIPVVPGGGITVNLDIKPGTTVRQGGSLTAVATVDTNGLPATSIVFALADLANGVDATLASPGKPVAIRSGQQQVTVTVAFAHNARLGPALGIIQWTPADEGASAPSDWLAADSLDVIVVPIPTPFWELPWPWVALFVVLVAGAAYLIWRRRFERERAELFGQPQPSAKRRTYTAPGPPGSGLRTGRYSQPESPAPRTGGPSAPKYGTPGAPPTAAGGGSAVEAKRKALGGRRWPWR